MATEEPDDANSDAAYSNIEINGTNDLICAPCHTRGEIQGAIGICKICRYYLCRQCVHEHRSQEQHEYHQIAFFYCAQKIKVNKLVRANSFCLDCGHYLCEKCRLDHGGFWEYRHHTFIGGLATPSDLGQETLLARRKALQSRSTASRKSTSRMSVFMRRECGNKSPYIVNNGFIPQRAPALPTITVEERVVERPRKLLISNVGLASNGTRLKSDDISGSTDVKRVHYEDERIVKPAELIGEYSLKGRGDRKPCKVISSVFVGDDQLVVSDQGNKNIKMFDKEFKFRSTMNIDNFPVALCKSRGDDSELFASSGNKLLLISTHKSLTLIRTINTEAPVIEGLTSWNTGVAIVFKSTEISKNRKGKIEVHLISHAGETQYEINISSQHVVQLVTPLWYVAMTNDDRFFLLSDTHNNRILCVDTKRWHIVFVLRGRAIGGAPTCLSVDREGNFLVTWYGEIRKISSDGRDLGVYVSDIAECASMSYNERTKHIAIPAWTETRQNRFRIYRTFD